MQVCKALRRERAEAQGSEWADLWVQVMTSFHPEGVDDHLFVIASTTVPQADGLPSRLRLKIPRSSAYFTGTGTIAHQNCISSVGFWLGCPALEMIMVCLNPALLCLPIEKQFCGYCPDATQARVTIFSSIVEHVCTIAQVI